MGLNLGALTTIFLGIGLGILTISCLTVTIVFSRDVNQESTINKYKYKLQFHPYNSLIETSIAIAVLGCISAAAALVAIIFSIFSEKNIILMILGGVASIFAFGCIVAEGLYTQKSRSSMLDIDFRSYSHKSAQNYIKKSIKDLYEQALKNFDSKCGDDLDKANISFKSWSYVKDKLGTVEDGKVFTYNNLWGSDAPANNDQIPSLFIYGKNPTIYAKYGKDYDTPVATLLFKTEFKNKRTFKTCWYTDKNTSLKCKTLNNITISNETTISVSEFCYENFEDTGDSYGCGEKYYESDVSNPISEKIVVGKYYPEKKINSDGISANYTVDKFPFAFKTLPFDQFNESSLYNAVADDSSRHYKVSAKKWAKAYAEEMSSVLDTENELYQKEGTFFITPGEPKDYADVIKQCNDYWNKYDDDDGSNICNQQTFLAISKFLRDHYDDYNKGKVAPYFKKYYGDKIKDDYKKLSKYPGLYSVALMNLIIQIFGIVFCAVGLFVPSNQDKMMSEGEA